MDDLIKRQDAIGKIKDWMKFIGYSHSERNVMECTIQMLEELPSAQPEIKPIDYHDCANAMLRMWMDKVVTDGEYNRIMDKLNAFWRTRNE